MNSNHFVFDWQDLAFSSKKPLNRLRAIFIMAPREISQARFKQLIKTYLPQGNIILGVAKETYVLGFENQPQFKLQSIDTFSKIIDQVNNSNTKAKIYQLHYFQREIKYLFEQLDFKKVILINGSWQYAWHTQAPYYILANRHITYEYVSPFGDEAEAKVYEKKLTPLIKSANPIPKAKLTAEEMMQKAIVASHYSYDYSFQTGTVLGKISSNKKTYNLITFAYNKVIPYQTYAMLHGASREQNFSPPNDLNFYDTIHAEVMLVLQAQKKCIKLSGTTLFINLLPCPTCARMLCETKISNIIYANDHTDGFALQLLQTAGKQINRLVINQIIH
jgi:deoxycytidylate deaminase